MGDIIQILIIIGVIIFALVKQVSKASEEAKQKQANRPMPVEDNEVEDWEFEKEQKKPTPFLSYDYDPLDSINTTKQTPPKKKLAENPKIPAPPPIQEEPATEQEFDIHSTEEVRRAIIWSEILNRKY